MIDRVLGPAGGIVTGVLLAGLSAVRRAKGVHPRGEVHEASLLVTGAPQAPSGATLLSTAAEHRALVRFSRSIGLPAPWPDLFGMAIRVLDAYGEGRHQDLLLISSADRPVLHHVFLPTTSIGGRPYTSALPYASGGRRFLVGALPDGPGFSLCVAPLMGRFAPIAELRVGARLPDSFEEMRFNVRNTGGGLEPVGVLNRMRDFAYPMSQWAWRRTRGRESHGAVPAGATADSA